MKAAEVAELSDSEVELSESEDDEQPEERSADGPRADAIYNVEAMHEKLEEIGRSEDIDWIQFPVVTYEYTGADIDANDDLAREVVFYTQALEGAREAIEKLRNLSIPIFRPEDYYAEMVKSDKHMLKIKDKLLFQKQKLEEADERKKQREAKKYSKEVQAEKVKERQKEKKRNIESVKKWRKSREQSGYRETNDEFPVDVDDGEGPARKKRKFDGGISGKGDGLSSRVERGSRGARGGKPNNDYEVNGLDTPMKNGEVSARSSRGKGEDRRGDRTSLTRGRGPSRRRQERDNQFGYGGRKSFSKRNTAESSADVGGFKSSSRGGFKGTARGGSRGLKAGHRGKRKP